MTKSKRFKGPFSPTEKFTKIPNQLIWNGRISPGAKAVASALMMLQGRSGYAFPSLKRLSENCGVRSTTSLTKYRRELQNAGILAYRRGSKRGRNQRSNRYWIRPISDWVCIDKPEHKSTKSNPAISRTINCDDPRQGLVTTKTELDKTDLRKKKLEAVGLSKEVRREISTAVEGFLLSKSYFSDLPAYAARAAVNHGKSALDHIAEVVANTDHFFGPKGAELREQLIREVHAAPHRKRRAQAKGTNKEEEDIVFLSK